MEGRYDVEELGPVTLTVEGDRVRVRVGEGDEHDCFGRNGFYVPDFDATIGFSRLDEGRFQRLHWISVFRVVTGERTAS